MEDCKPANTPIATTTKLDLDPDGNNVDQKYFCSIIGSLLYLCASRPDIMFSVYLCARFQGDLRESHLTGVKRILRYLQGTPKIGLWYPKGARLELVGYSNSDYG